MNARELGLTQVASSSIAEISERGQYPRVLRTLQRRVSTWKALHGPAPNVMFMLRHEPGVKGLSDFTKLKGMEITINGAPFEYLIYHYRLAYSGWQYAQIIQGGESFVGLSEGLQNALIASGGTPKEHRTDSLSAAYRNLGGHCTSDLTRLYDDLCDHYRMVPTRNNLGLEGAQPFVLAASVGFDVFPPFGSTDYCADGQRDDI